MSRPNLFRHTLLASAIFLVSTSSAIAAEAANGEMEEVIVAGQKQPYRGDTPLESLPQAIQILSGELLLDSGVTQLQTALDLAGGIARQNSFGGLWDSFAIRGFAGDENVPSGYLINGFNAGRGFSGRRDASNIESIEVLKGPGSALYGRSEPGGTVNLITKKPSFDTEGYVMVSAGSNDTYRIEADYTTALSETVAFRINGAYNDAESYRDTVSSEKYVITPSILFSLSESTTLTYELELLDQEAPFDRGIVAINGDPESLPISRFLGEPNDGPMEIDANGHQLVLQHDLNNGWSVLAGAGYRDSGFKGFSSDAELSGGRQLLLVDGETLSRQRRYRDYQAEDMSARLELTGSFDTGGLSHHILMGADIYDFELDQVQNRFRVGWGSGDTTYSINIFNPVYGQPQPTPGPLTDTLEEQESWGIYIQDQIDLNENWKLLLGVRHDDFSQDITNRRNGSKSSQSQTSTNPRVGLVFEMNEMVSIYASYSEGFRPNSGSNFAGSAFTPEESESYELGAKISSSDGRLSGTIAFFNAEKSNILTADPVNSGFSAALGEAESEGIEVDITGNLTDDLKIWFSYSYVDAQTSNDVINADWGVNIPAGSALLNIPEHSANLTLIQSFKLNDSDATLGLGVNYVDERLGETIDASYMLPDYTLVKLFGSYSPTEKIKLMFDVDNLLDEEYYPSSYSKFWTMVGSDRTFTFRARYDF